MAAFSGSASARAADSAITGIVAHVGRYRWTICALLFFATTINYIDRQVIGILAPTLQRELGWNEVQYGAIVSWFSVAYAVGFLVAGRLLDVVGARIGYALSVVLWSLAAMSNVLVRTVFGFSAARFALGLGESGNFPAAIKTVAEWFPARERAFATGILNSGTNVGAIITPLVVPWIALVWGWRVAFVATGALGFLWVGVWLVTYHRPEGQALPESVRDRISWSALLGHRQTWAFALGKFMTDPVWWFYLYWLPKFLDARYGIRLSQLAMPLILVYVLADVGSIGGGYSSGALMKRGWTVNAARKVTMLAAALAIVPVMVAPRVTGLWLAVGIVAVAASAHQWWSANMYTLSSDLFPPGAVGTVMGIGGFAGAAGGVLFQRVTGLVLQTNGGNYAPIFVVCAFAYVVALGVVQLLSPRLEPVSVAPPV